jgi:hypothetical protein
LSGTSRRHGDWKRSVDAGPHLLEANMSDQAPKPAGDSSEQGEAGVHPIVVKIAIAAVLWFLAVTWLAFAGSGGVDWDLTVVSLFFGIFITLFLLLASFSVSDPRWPTRTTSLHEFMTSKVGLATGEESGRDVLIEIALVPVALAFAATLIGLAWVIFG